MWLYAEMNIIRTVQRYVNQAGVSPQTTKTRRHVETCNS